MSRVDAQDFEYPPGLTFAHGGGDHDFARAGPMVNGYGAHDRRGLAFVPYGSQFARSVGSQQGLHGGEFDGGAPLSPDSWPNTNRFPAGAAHVQQLSSFYRDPSHHPELASAHGFDPRANQFHIHTLYSTNPYADRDPYIAAAPRPSPPQPSPPANDPRLDSTVWWGELEPWMDEEYAKQVCNLMGWNPVDVKVPQPLADTSGQQPVANNPGYCFLTFSTPAQAQSVFSQINHGANPVIMPNSTRPFAVNMAVNVPVASLTPSFPAAGAAAGSAPNMPPFQKEYSIFVGDLAPEASNSDLVAVFRNPVLGLRNDREPKFIRPFLSCKSAKIMLDAVTGVSKGYGFVRFTDEADQQRALVEMHGLYCLSRPMRISPATAKFKAPPGGADFPGAPPAGAVPVVEQPQAVTIAVPLANRSQSVSSPVAMGAQPAPSVTAAAAPSASTGSISTPTLSASSSASSASNKSEETLTYGQNVLAQLAAQYANGGLASVAARPAPAPANSVAAQFAAPPPPPPDAGKYVLSEESWKHHAQARAILSNLIGPNGEQLTSTDPYNTTVFVGGLSPLISEETLRTFFAPFGDIHYVKVPVGKHCGFVQFVRKADAEKAIEKMQGFPIGGSRIRLSWGRSQYKAAQAAAQAAQQAALRDQFQPARPTQPPATVITPEQAMQILRDLDRAQSVLAVSPPAAVAIPVAPAPTYADSAAAMLAHEDRARAERRDGAMLDSFSAASFARRPSNVDPGFSQMRHHTGFSPFSPDPSQTHYNMERPRSGDAAEQRRHEAMSHPFGSYGPGFGASSIPLREQAGSNSLRSGSASPVTPTSTSAPRRAFFGAPDARSFTNANEDGYRRSIGDRPQTGVAAAAPIARPSSSRNAPAYGARANEEDGHEDSSIQDLNGTLASLNIDNQDSWKTAGSDDKVAQRA